MKVVTAGIFRAPMALKRKKTKMSQKTTRAMPFDGTRARHHLLDVVVRLGLVELAVHADLLEHLAHHDWRRSWRR